MRRKMENEHLVIQTERLLLRPLAESDLDQMITLLGDEEALVMWGGALTPDEAHSWIVRNIARYGGDGYGRCAVVWRESGELVGDCGLVSTTVEDVPEIELGWITRRSHWGRGIATEAATAWRDFAFGVLELDRIVSMVLAENVASRRVAEKLGMTVEREAQWGDRPHLMYALFRGSVV
jgi:RimJ/RimL family protein N-acetyltransferase